MSTLRISNIEAKSVPASATIDEKVKITNSSGDPLVFIDGKTSGITTVGINTTDANITFDANSNVVVTGIITATRFSGQITPTSLEIGSNIKLGNAGVITATSFVGSGANLTSLPSQLTLSNNADNRVITGGSGTNLNGEVNLTFDGTYLNIGTTDNTPLAVGGISGALSTSARANITLKTGATDGAVDTGSGLLFFNHSGTGHFFGGSLQVLKENGTSGNTASLMRFCTRPNGGSVTERLRIDSNGHMLLGGTSSNTFAGLQRFDIFNTSTADNYHGSLIRLITKNAAGNATTSYDMVKYKEGTVSHNNNESSGSINFYAGGATRLQVLSTGNININDGDLVIGTAGHGIDFSATANSGGTMSNELLDDYEEGSFTFVRKGHAGGFDSNYQLANQTGKYTKIGRLVTLKGGFNLTGNSGNIAAQDYFTLNMSSLPFAMDDTSSAYSGAIISHQGAWWAYTSLGGGSNAKGSVIAVYNDYLSFYCTSVTGSPVRNSNEITFTITYTSTT